MSIPGPASLTTWIEKKARARSYPFRLALLLACASYFFASPNFKENRNERARSWQVTMLKAQDLTAPLSELEGDGWLAKKVFRLTVPVVIRVLHLGPGGVIALQYLLGLLLLVVCYRLSLHILTDPVSATFVSAGLAFVYFGRACFLDVTFTWFDGWAYLLLLLALIQPHPATVFLWVTLAAWTDERAFMVLPIVALYHQVTVHGAGNLRLRRLLMPGRPALSVLLAMAVHLALRTWMQHRFGMRTPTDGANLDVLKKDLDMLPFGVWTFLEGFWMLPVASVLFALRKRQFAFLMVLACVLAVVTVTAGCVYDITRSGSYVCPLIFVLLVHLKDHLEGADLRRLTLAAAVVSILFPAYFVIATWKPPSALFRPLIIELWRWWS